MDRSPVHRDKGLFTLKSLQKQLQQIINDAQESAFNSNVIQGHFRPLIEVIQFFVAGAIQNIENFLSQAKRNTRTKKQLQRMNTLIEKQIKRWSLKKTARQIDVKQIDTLQGNTKDVIDILRLKVQSSKRVEVVADIKSIQAALRQNVKMFVGGKDICIQPMGGNQGDGISEEGNSGLSQLGNYLQSSIIKNSQAAQFKQKQREKDHLIKRKTLTSGLNFSSLGARSSILRENSLQGIARQQQLPQVNAFKRASTMTSGNFSNNLNSGSSLKKFQMSSSPTRIKPRQSTLSGSFKLDEIEEIKQFDMSAKQRHNKTFNTKMTLDPLLQTSSNRQQITNSSGSFDRQSSSNYYSPDLHKKTGGNSPLLMSQQRFSSGQRKQVSFQIDPDQPPSHFSSVTDTVDKGGSKPNSKRYINLQESSNLPSPPKTAPHKARPGLAKRSSSSQIQQQSRVHNSSFTQSQQQYQQSQISMQSLSIYNKKAKQLQPYKKQSVKSNRISNIFSLSDDVLIQPVQGKSQILLYDLQKQISRQMDTHVKFPFAFGFHQLRDLAFVCGGRVGHPFTGMALATNFAMRKNCNILMLKSMQYSRGGLACTSLRKRYIFATGGSNKEYLSVCQRYDINTNNWEPIPSHIQCRGYHALTSLGTKYIYAICGWNGVDDLLSIQRYKWHADQWEMIQLEGISPLWRKRSYISAIGVLGTGNEQKREGVLKARRNSASSLNGDNVINDQGLENAILVFGKNNGNNATFVLEVSEGGGGQVKIGSVVLGGDLPNTYYGSCSVRMGQRVYAVDDKFQVWEYGGANWKKIG